MTAALTVDIAIADPEWTSILPGTESVVRETALAAWAGAPDVPAVPSEISILLADDATVQDLNREHRGKDQPTNVLSFPIGPGEDPAGAPVMLGDVVLASGVILREASAQGKTVAAHLRHLVVHGVLHLLGYDHETDPDAESMESLEVDILETLAVPNPYIYREAAE
jgi:probable rRNA maturation factor